MPNALVQFVTKPVRLGIKWYLSKPRDFSYKNISVIVLPGVFHPGFFHSTKMLLGFLNHQDINKKEFLELGCGSGIISVIAMTKIGMVKKAATLNFRSSFP